LGNLLSTPVYRRINAKSALSISIQPKNLLICRSIVTCRPVVEAGVWEVPWFLEAEKNGGSFVLFGILIARVNGYDSYMCDVGKRYCTTKMTVGYVIMGGAAYSSTTRSSVVTRDVHKPCSF